MAYAWALRTAGSLPRQRSEGNWPPRRIFVAYPYFSVGDTVLVLPLLERVHRLWPDAEIDIAMGESMAEIVASLPFLHRVDRMVRPSAGRPLLQHYAEARAILRQFRQSPAAGVQYDLAIAPRWSGQDGFLSVFQTYLTGAPVRCGYSRKAYEDGPDVDRLLTHAATGGVGEHESRRYTELVARCGLESAGATAYDAAEAIPALQKIAEERVRAGVAFHIDAPQGYVVLSPGATNGRRMWPLERFAEVAQWAQQQGWAVVAIGSKEDAALCDALPGVQSLAGKTSAIEMLDVIAVAKLFVGNDSGPAHIAGAVGVPTVVVSPFPASFHGEHVNAPSRFRPVGGRVRVLQPEESMMPCVDVCEMSVAHCILGVSVAQVIESAEELISKL